MSLTDGPPPTTRSARHRSTRDRPAKAPLSKDAIVDAALAVLKSGGLAAVTMRRVARALDTGAMSLYVYVSGREGLLQAMLGRVIATIELELPDPSRWRAQLHSLLVCMHQALVAHPGIASSHSSPEPRPESTDEGIDVVAEVCASRPLMMLVNNAGVAHYMPIAELPAVKARELVHIKVVAPTMLIPAAVAGWPAAKGRSSTCPG